MHYYVGIEDIKELINHNDSEVDLSCNDIPVHLELAKQKTGYGEKLFLKCPLCGSRRTELFLCKDMLVCRTCYPKNIYAEIQNHSVGCAKYIGKRMKAYAKRHNIEIQRFPFRYYDYEKPANRKEQSWVDNIAVLQALENMRFQAIFLNKRWSAKTIRSVINWKNSFLYLSDLGDMLDYTLPWDKGVDMNTNFTVKEGNGEK